MDVAGLVIESEGPDVPMVQSVRFVCAALQRFAAEVSGFRAIAYCHAPSGTRMHPVVRLGIPRATVCGGAGPARAHLDGLG